MKRLLPIILCIMLALSVAISGATTEEEVSTPAVTEEFSAPDGVQPPQMPDNEGMAFNGEQPPQRNAENIPSGTEGEMPQMGGGRGGRRMGGGGGQPSQMQGGENVMPQNGGNTSAIQPSENSQGNTATDNTQNQAAPDATQMPQMGGRGGPGGGMGMMQEEFQRQGNMAAQTGSASILDTVKEYLTPIISVILLLLAFPFVIFYRRKNY